MRILFAIIFLLVLISGFKISTSKINFEWLGPIDIFFKIRLKIMKRNKEEQEKIKDIMDENTKLKESYYLVSEKSEKLEQIVNEYQANGNSNIVNLESQIRSRKSDITNTIKLKDFTYETYGANIPICNLDSNVEGYFYYNNGEKVKMCCEINPFMSDGQIMDKLIDNLISFRHIELILKKKDKNAY